MFFSRTQVRAGADPVRRVTSRPHLGSRVMGLLVIALLTLAVPAVASAEDSPARKLGRGAANLGLGVLAIPDQVIETTKVRGPALGVTWGLVKGTGVMLATEAVGLFEIMTCPFATPPDYRQILDPEFPWQRFTSEGDQKPSRRRGRIAREGGRRVQE